MKRLGLVLVCLSMLAAACSLPSVAPGTAGFPNGVAAGDVTDNGAILWTRTSARPTSRSTSTTRCSRPARSSRCRAEPGLHRVVDDRRGRRLHDQGAGERTAAAPHLLLPVHERRRAEPARSLRDRAGRRRGRELPLRGRGRLRRLPRGRSACVQQLRGAQPRPSRPARLLVVPRRHDLLRLELRARTGHRLWTSTAPRTRRTVRSRTCATS